METLNPGMLHVFQGVDSVSSIFQKVESINARNFWYDIWLHLSFNN